MLRGVGAPRGGEDDYVEDDAPMAGNRHRW